ncbi:hypothetical protein OHA63_34680 [Streptomyces anulatus]|uniref:hypothetical protein n=2 Tax=Streptomyces anulatus TaxID=1892 RepID=UPI002E31A7D7|nr:hypothetical protein [Streptomyces anulatus]
MTFQEEQAYMSRATTPAAVTVALRGLLVLLVAAVGLLCLLGRTSPQDTALSCPASVSQVATVVQPSADEGSAPCGKKPVVAEDVAPRSDAASGTAPGSGSPRWTDGPVPTAGPGAPFRRGGPAPPHPVTTFSVLRI